MIEAVNWKYLHTQMCVCVREREREERKSEGGREALLGTEGRRCS